MHLTSISSNKIPIFWFVFQFLLIKIWAASTCKYPGFVKKKDNFFSVFRTLLSADTMLVFDNWRILHGRTAFRGERKLVGCYVPYEDWVAKARGIQAI